MGLLSINEDVRYSVIFWFYVMGVLATAVLFAAGHVGGVTQVQGYWMVVRVYAPYVPSVCVSVTRVLVRVSVFVRA